jgi:hypothetical protein
MEPPEKGKELRCPGCYSSRVAEGRVSASEGSCRFELPPQQIGFWGTFGPQVELTQPAFLCIECGMMWTRADKQAALQEIAHGANDDVLDRLKITARPKRRWRWLLFGRR